MAGTAPAVARSSPVRATRAALAGLQDSLARSKILEYQYMYLMYGWMDGWMDDHGENERDTLDVIPDPSP